MAEILLGAIVEVVFEKLASVGITRFMKLVKGKKIDPKTIQKWEKTLRLIAALLSDAEQRQTESNAVKLWLEDLQDLAYDLEDILDDFATEVQLHQLKKTQKEEDDDGAEILEPRFLHSAKHKVKSIFACGSRVGQHFQYSGGDLCSKIEDISNRLEHIQTQAGDLGLSARSIMQQETQPTEAPKGWRQSTSLVCEPVVYGRDDKRNNIIEILLKDDPSYENVVVIPIVGMGGIGKTTLAQYVYNDEQQLKGHFDLKAWVCISDVFDVTRVTTELVNSLTKKNHSFSNLNQAQENLMEVLKGKKFLIVLDDIWSENYNDWNQLQTPFREGLKGSRVIVTTRKDITARMVINNPTHSTTITLKGLSNDDCWRIFQQHSNYDSELAGMRDDIIRKCKGLPLAAKALGGLLKSTLEKSQRRKILESNIWSEESSVLPALRLSYHHLPPHLKRMFAYCSVLPKDYKFEELEVVLLWMAQGFIPENNQERMEDVGHNYFFDLVSRSLFEECPSNGEKSRMFTMHDLIHDLAQWASGDLCCLMDTMDMQKSLRRTRHLFFSANCMDKILGKQLLASQLRTFLCSSNYYSDGMNIRILDNVQNFQYLRTLRLASSKIEVLPEYIGGLKHLRFLSLLLINIEVLPESISQLCNLQALFLRGCRFLKVVPNIRFLVNLRYLDIDGTSLKEMPPGIEKLTNLQTLKQFNLLYGRGSRVRELKNLNHLRGSLRISGLENVLKVEDAQEAQLSKKHGLDELYLNWGVCVDEVDDNTKKDVVEELKPHTCIKLCVLDAYSSLTFPTWLGNPSYINMVDIMLSNCKNCESLPPLGQLPLLKNLWVEALDGIKEVGEEFYGSPDCSIAFPALRLLSFRNMGSWEKWVHSATDNRAFPCLDLLSIEYCLSLQGDLPPNLPSLTTLEITKCTELSISIPSLPLLEKLIIEACKVLSTTEDVIFCKKTMILHNISEIIGLPGRCLYLREELSIRNCHSLITIEQLPMTLRLLKIRNCHELQAVDFEESSPFSSCLEEVSVKYCQRIVAISQIPSTLQQLEIEGCQKLQFVEFKKFPCSSSSSKEILGGEAINHRCNSLTNRSSGCDKNTFKIDRATEADAVSVRSLEVSAKQAELSPKAQCELAHLTHLTIIECPSLKSLQEGLVLPCLQHLELIGCKNMEGLPYQMQTITSLQTLFIQECPKIDCFPEGVLPINLTSLGIEEVNIKQPIQEWGLHLLTSLEELTLENVGNSMDSVECLDVYLPSSLSELEIKGFPNLKSICCSSLPDLTRISMKSCPMFKSFGDNGLPPQLEAVYVQECDFIEQQLKSDPNGRIQITPHPDRYSLG